jgi:transaldolase
LQVDEIKELAGIDFLTISPSLLEKLKDSTEQVPKKLNAQEAAKATDVPKVTYVDDEPKFRWALLEEEMAFDKLHEGIRKFALDGEELQGVLRKKLSE